MSITGYEMMQRTHWVSWQSVDYGRATFVLVKFQTRRHDLRDSFEVERNTSWELTWRRAVHLYNALAKQAADIDAVTNALSGAGSQGT